MSSETKKILIGDDMPTDDSKDEKKYLVSMEPKNPLLCKVMMLDGTDASFRVEKKALGKVLFIRVCEHLNLLEKEYFALTFKQKPDQKIWLDNEKPILKQLNGNPCDFALEVKFYPQNPCFLKEELTRYQIYLQVRVDVLSGKLPCSFLSNALLASYACQSQLGDYDSSEHGPSGYYISEIKFCPGQTEELNDKIFELHKTHRGLCAADAEYMYLENARNMSLYGSHFFNIKDENDSPITLTVNSQGICLYKDRIRVVQYSWIKMIKLAYKRNLFMMTLRKGETRSQGERKYFFMPNFNQAQRMWKLIVEHHAFFRLKAPLEPQRNLFSRRSRNFYSGMTQFQANEAAEHIKRQSTNFNREYHTMGRGGLADSKPSIEIGGSATVDRTEETIAVEITSRTLERTKRNKSSVSGVENLDNTMSKQHVSMNTDVVEKSGYVYNKTPYPENHKSLLNQELDVNTPFSENIQIHGYSSFGVTEPDENQDYLNNEQFFEMESKRKDSVNIEDEHDKLLAQAIMQVAEVDPDLSVEKIEITRDE